MSLTQQLAEFSAGLPARMPAERIAIMERATQDLIASGIAERGVKVGDIAPDVALPDAVGRQVRLADLLQRGPVLLTFYRGGWCPYCNMELRFYQSLMPEIAALGAMLVAISPQTPDKSLTTAEKNALTFPVLSDVGGKVGDRFGLMFELPPDLQKAYRDIGNDLAIINGNGDYRLPIPATYVIARNGRIAFAHVDPDYRRRADPDQVLRALRDVGRQVS